MRRLYDQHGTVLRQFVKFGLVGGAGVVVNMIVTVILNKLNGGTVNAQRVLISLPGTPYNIRYTTFVWIGAFCVAVVFNFVLNRYWTFRHGDRRPSGTSSGRSSRSARWRRRGIFIKIALTNPTSPLFLPELYWHETPGCSRASTGASSSPSSSRCRSTSS